ncbi:MAG: hypothetical protein R2809_06495 [Flavobacteriales bacterium]
MKTTTKIFGVLFSVAMLVACSGSESEMLKQARTIQEAMMKSKSELDSSLAARLNAYSEEVTLLSQDAELATDSVKMANYDEIKSAYSDLEMLKAELNDWTMNVKMLPSAEEIAGGAENPFGGDMKDEDILKEIKASQEKFEDLKSRIETEIQ